MKNINIKQKKETQPKSTNYDLMGAEIVTISKLKKLNARAFEIMKDWDNKATVYYYAENKIIKKDFKLDEYLDDDGLGFVFAHDLTIEGDLIQMEGDFGPHLIVLGSLNARSVDVGGSYIEVDHHCNAKEMIYGYYNHGVLKINGTVSAKYIISEDYCFEFKKTDSKNLILNIDVYNCNLERIFLPKLIKSEFSLDTKAIRSYLAEGKEILKKNWKIVEPDEDDDE